MNLTSYIPKTICIVIILISVALMAGSSENQPAIPSEIESINSNLSINSFTEDYSVIYPLASFVGGEENIQYARVIPILLSAIVLFVFYMWSAGIIGAWWALMPISFLAFSPIFLAFGYLVGPEIAKLSSLLFTIMAVTSIAIYKKVKLLSMLGILSAILLYPSATPIIISAGAIYAFIYVPWRIRGRRKKRRAVLTIGAVALVSSIITTIVFFLASMQEHISFSFVELLQHYSIKESIAMIMLVSVAIISASINIVSNFRYSISGIRNYIAENPELFLGLLASILYLLPHYLSYADTPAGKLLPILPLIYLLTASGVRSIIKGGYGNGIFKMSFVLLFIAWHTVNAFLAFPSYMTYVNESHAGYSDMGENIIEQYNGGN